MEEVIRGRGRPPIYKTKEELREDNRRHARTFYAKAIENKIICNCGKHYDLTNKSRHLKTQFHINNS